MTTTDEPAQAELQFHPIANVFPLIEGEEFKALVEDIREHGVLEPIWLYEGKILDGRNRYRAYQAAFPDTDEDPPFREYLDDKPVEFVVSLNLKRRHLSESQRAMVAADIATLTQGARTDLASIEAMSQPQAAELLNVSRSSVQRATTVRDHGAPELQQAVRRGDVKVSVAAEVAKLSAEEQREVIANLDPKELMRAAKEARAKKFENTYNKKVARLQVISGGNASLASEQRYPVILADPPWKFHAYETSGKFMGVPEDHYPTMDLDEIVKLPVSDMATKDAGLFLWTANSTLPEALQVLTAWGFNYTTNIAWVKDKSGLGFWVRNQHEILIIARRGDFPSPPPSQRSVSIIQAPRREHSRKPDEAYELIERMYPDLPKIELFARQARPGWACWGNQAPVSDAA